MTYSVEERREYYKKWNEANRDKLRENSARWRAKQKSTSLGWAKLRWTAVKGRAAREGIAFDLTPEDIRDAIPQDGLCPILGTPLIFDGEKKDGQLASLDRKVPNLGYTKGNIVVMSYRANRLKCDEVDPAIFRKLADYLELNN